MALAAIKGDRTLAQLAEQFDVHPNQITSWKAQLEGGAADVFGPGGGNAAAQPAVDVKSLHAKIGELTLENDFLEGALNKAGLLSAKHRDLVAYAEVLGGIGPSNRARQAHRPDARALHRDGIRRALRRAFRTARHDAPDAASAAGMADFQAFFLKPLNGNFCGCACLRLE